MVRLCGWNVSGLNWPNKQEDLKIFLQLNNLGLVGLFETKIKMKNVAKIPSRLFQGWRWEHNFSHSPKGRIWITWKPNSFTVQVLSMSAQHIQCYIFQPSDMQQFYITYVYGENQEGLGQELWQTLRDIATNMDDAWCMLGDFNAVLYKGDKMGGNEIQDHEVQPFSECIHDCGLQELRYKGPYYTLTN